MRTEDDEKSTLEDALADARALVIRLENALGRLGSEELSEHPVVYWRHRRGYTQAAVARMIGITPAALCRIEHSPGLATSKETGRKLAEALSVPLAWLQPAQPGIASRTAAKR